MTDSNDLPTRDHEGELIPNEKRMEILSKYFVKLHIYTVEHRDQR